MEVCRSFLVTTDVGGPVHDDVAGCAVPVADKAGADPILLEQLEQSVATLLPVNLIAESPALQTAS